MAQGRRACRLVGVLWLVLAPLSAAAAESDWFINAYVAQATFTRFNQAIRLDTDLKHSWLAAVGGGRRLRSLGPRTGLEAELLLAQHWGMQHHKEVDALLALRWSGFRWERYLPTTMALGTGLSYAFDRPAIEADAGEATYALQYLMLELAVAPRRWGAWSGFLRVHHRSGAFGLVSDADGSNFIGLGLRRHFGR